MRVHFAFTRLEVSLQSFYFVHWEHGALPSGDSLNFPHWQWNINFPPVPLVDITSTCLESVSTSDGVTEFAYPGAKVVVNLWHTAHRQVSDVVPNWGDTCLPT